MESPECKGIIRRAWTEKGLRELDCSVEPKLTSCQRHLIQWISKHFGNNKVELRKAKEILKELTRVVP